MPLALETAFSIVLLWQNVYICTSIEGCLSSHTRRQTGSVSHMQNSHRRASFPSAFFFSTCAPIDGLPSVVYRISLSSNVAALEQIRQWSILPACISLSTPPRPGGALLDTVPLSDMLCLILSVLVSTAETFSFQAIEVHDAMMSGIHHQVSQLTHLHMATHLPVFFVETEHLLSYCSHTHPMHGQKVEMGYCILPFPHPRLSNEQSVLHKNASQRKS